MGSPPRVLFVNPTDEIRNTIPNLAASLPSEFDCHVLLPHECKDTMAEIGSLTYHYYGARYVPGIRYTLPGIDFTRKAYSLIGRSDIVHVMDYDFLPCLQASILSKAMGTSTIVTVDAVPGIGWSYGNRLVDGIARLYTLTAGRIMLRIVDRVVGLGEFLRADLLSITPRAKLDIIPNGIDVENFSPPVENVDRGGNPVKLLYVGRLDPVKGIPRLLRAMQLLEKSDRNYELTIVGDGTERERYRRLASELGVRERVSFEGWQSDVTSYYRTHDLFVLSSISEGQSTVLMEAQACGCPVVATDVGAARELVGGGVVVEGDSPAAFAQAIQSLAERNLDDLRTKAREHIVSRYSEERMAEEYAEIYRELFSR